jgi:hypothetical protein
VCEHLHSGILQVKPSQRRALCLALIALCSACSSLNREGPLATCAELDAGAINACGDGIIASCSDGEHVTYRVCTEDVNGTSAKDLCGEAWQQPGMYRCNPEEELPK